MAKKFRVPVICIIEAITSRIWFVDSWMRIILDMKKLHICFFLGELPTVVQLDGFHETLTERRTLPPNFVRDVIMKAPSHDMMNNISRAILNLYSYDEKC